MTRRIVSGTKRICETFNSHSDLKKVRTGVQLGLLTVIVLFLVYLLDNRFNVLPNAIHNALPLHHPGLVITDITVATCSTLNLLSSCKLDAQKWSRVEKDLYLSRGWLSHAFVNIQRKRESELTENDKVILDVRISKLDPATSEKNQGTERWESRPGGIWLKRTAKHRESDSHQAVTAVDILFGSDSVEPRSGWEMVRQNLILPDAGSENQGAYLSIRRGPPVEPEKPTLHVNKDGNFKILQISDLHLSTGPGLCRDPEPPSSQSSSGHCDADPRTLSFVTKVLDLEKPDLLILSGDQVNGETAPDSQSALFKIASICATRKLPYALIFGNHDDEGSLSREALMQLSENLPFSLTEAGPTGLDGIGNYVVEVYGRSGSTHSALTLYLLDTHGYSPDERQFRGYDWLKKNQIDWFRKTAEELRHKPSHTGYAHKHMDMAFIHIPLPEYRNTEDFATPATGQMLENPTAPGFNSGFRDALVQAGVVAVSCGHDHVNDYCALSKGALPDASEAKGKSSHSSRATNDGHVWMCYAGGSGFGGYGGYGGYHRRVRVWDFDMNQGRIVTWKRVENGEGVVGKERTDEALLVEMGRPVPVK